MTQTEARQWLEAEIDRLERAPIINGCSMTEEWQTQLDVFRLCKAALDGSAIDAKYDMAYRNGYKTALEFFPNTINALQGTIYALEAEKNQLQKERDALLADVKMISDIDGVCRVCKHYESFLHNSKCWKDCGEGDESKFEWRGVDHDTE